MPANRRRAPLALLALAPLAAGCLGAGTSAAVPLVRAHAAYDLDCPDRDVRIEEELGGRFVAIGCGRKARYTAACDGLSCVVRGEGEPAIPWRDRPDPSAPHR